MSRRVFSRKGTSFTAHGFTLVEFMIALFLGAFLATVSTSMYGSFRSASLLHGEMVDANNEIRMVMDVVRDEVLKAGYRSDFLRDLDVVFPATRPLGRFRNFSFAKGEVIEGDRTFLVIRYQGDLDSEPFRIKDCIGQPIKARTQSIVSLSFDSSKRALICRSSTNNQTVTLVENVKSLTFRFGIDLDSDGYADRYILDTKGNSNPVVSVGVQAMVDRSKSDLPGAESGLKRSGSQVIMMRNGA